MKYDRDHLILEHLKLAEEIAIKEWRTATHALEKDEMMSLAYLGLVDAAQRWEAYCIRKEYDPDAIQFFKVFARLRIRGTIRDSIRSADWATRTLRSKSKRLKDAGQDEGLSVQELAERTGMTINEINKVNNRLSKKPVSLDAKLGSQTLEGHQEIQIKEDIDTEGSAFANEMIEIFINTVKTLPIEEQVVIALHYYTKLDLKHVAEELQISEVQVSQLHNSGVSAVKAALTYAATERG
jgi:RNA polymerase sigma factor FliA